ncbi:hypothetical protein PA257_5727 [Pseudomonas aeruginosa]|nr:hypothetical protein PA257_5727 [Pseudomonas aeruginosa]
MHGNHAQYANADQHQSNQYFDHAETRFSRHGLSSVTAVRLL